jgi:hypothetical protein
MDAHVNLGDEMKLLKRIWCKLFHNNLMLPFKKVAICRICQTVWEVNYD